ncbi:uncharacterized protein V6R79_017080 [Siganus canaliculatus]
MSGGARWRRSAAALRQRGGHVPLRPSSPTFSEAAKNRRDFPLPCSRCWLLSEDQTFTRAQNHFPVSAHTISHIENTHKHTMHSPPSICRPFSGTVVEAIAPRLSSLQTSVFIKTSSLMKKSNGSNAFFQAAASDADGSVTSEVRALNCSC